MDAPNKLGISRKTSRQLLRGRDVLAFTSKVTLEVTVARKVLHEEWPFANLSESRIILLIFCPSGVPTTPVSHIENLNEAMLLTLLRRKSLSLPP